VKPEAAKAAILREFRKLSGAQRESVADRLTFARQMKDKFQLTSSADPDEIIMGWLVNEISDDDW
jgi:hypothetical protein